MLSELSELSELSDFHKGAFAPVGSDKTQTRLRQEISSWLQKLASKTGFTQDLLYVHMAAMNPQKNHHSSYGVDDARSVKDFNSNFSFLISMTLKTLKVLNISTPILFFCSCSCSIFHPRVKNFNVFNVFNARSAIITVILWSSSQQ